MEPETQELLEHFSPYLVVLVVSLIMVTRFFRGVLPHIVLGELLFVQVTRPEVVVPPQAEAVSKKQEKKLQQQIKAAQTAGPTIRWCQMTPKLLRNLEFTEEFDYMMLAGLVLMICGVSIVLMKMFLTPAIPTVLFTLVVTNMGFLLYMMVQVEWDHVVIMKTDKIYMLLAGVVGAVVSFMLLMFVPDHLLAFYPKAACEELLGRLQSVVRSRLKNADLAMPPANAIFVATPIALAAGTLSALLMAPGLRYGRVLQQLLKPPLWARHFKAGNSLMQFLARAGFVVQVMLIPVWVTPLTDVLLIPEPALCYMRGLAMLLAAVLQGAALPTLVQSFLFTAPFQADVIQNTPDVDASQRTLYVKQQCTLILSQTSKAALQLSFLPMLLMVCGFVQILMAFPSPLAETSSRATEWDKKPSVLYQCVAGYLGWWGSTAYVAWASLGIIFARVRGGTE